MNHLKTRLYGSLILLLVGASIATAQATVLHSFSKQVDGSQPMGNLIMDSHGNLYGTTATGGPQYQGGTVFELIAVPGGGWTEKILHNFNSSPGSGDGYDPSSTLIFDGHGNLYGITYEGGAYGQYDQSGTVFELSPAPDGSWTETLLYSFDPFFTPDGTQPGGKLALDANGNLYGTTSTGGTNAIYLGGTVFELTPAAGGWTKTVLHTFGQTATDGSFPVGGLTIDSAGVLYGVTQSGGAYSQGIAYKLLHQTDDSWTETILHSFNPAQGDGKYPFAPPVLDSKGNLYGTTEEGGEAGGGTLYELSPGTGGAWIEKLFSVFTYPGYATGPLGAVTIDSQGNLYATASECGGALPCTGNGLAFKLTSEAGGNWKETPLARFGGDSGKGPLAPHGGLTLDSHGNLYGVTATGGSQNEGTVFQIGPNAGVTTTTLDISPAGALTTGEAIRLVATVTSASDSPITTGRVMFSDPAFPGRGVTVPLDGMGQAVLAGGAPKPGSYSIVATYIDAEGVPECSSQILSATVH